MTIIGVCSCGTDVINRDGFSPNVRNPGAVGRRIPGNPFVVFLKAYFSYNIAHEMIISTISSHQ